MVNKGMGYIKRHVNIYLTLFSPCMFINTSKHYTERDYAVER
jgi:hypothetical protein